MYFVVNVENLKLYEPHMIVDQDVQVEVPYVDEFAPEYLNELQEYVIFDKKVGYSQRGDMEFLHVGMKGMQPRKSQWLETGRVRELYPHLFSE